MRVEHYRELVTEDAAKAWFAIAPPENWTPPAVRWNRRKRQFHSESPRIDSAGDA